MLSPLIVGCRPRSHTGLKLNGADIMMKIIKFKKIQKKKKKPNKNEQIACLVVVLPEVRGRR